MHLPITCFDAFFKNTVPPYFITQHGTIGPNCARCKTWLKLAKWNMLFCCCWSITSEPLSQQSCHNALSLPSVQPPKNLTGALPPAAISFSLNHQRSWAKQSAKNIWLRILPPIKRKSTFPRGFYCSTWVTATFWHSHLMKCKNTCQLSRTQPSTS